MADFEPAQHLEEFLQLLRSSQLLDDNVIDSALDDFCGVQMANRGNADGRAFESYLVVRGYLTCWQCKKLRAGRFKGFRLDHFKLRDHIESGDASSRFVAEDTRTGKILILAVTPPSIAPLNGGRPHYTVEDYGG